MSATTKIWPDAQGRFGPYGGRYVPETLMAPLEELEREYEEAKRDPNFQKELDDLLKTFAGRPTPLSFRAAPDRKSRRRANLSQARRPAPHRRAQDQQLPRPGAARGAHGQAPHHRGNRRRPARRRHRHRLRAARPRVRRLHGRGGHGAPGAQRLPHAPARRRSARRRFRLAHAERRHQRSHARLGHQRPHHALPARQRAWARIRIPTMVRDFHRVIGREARAQILEAKGAAGLRSSPASAAARTPSALFYDFIDDAKCTADRRRSRRPRHDSSANTPRAASSGFGARPACCRAPTPTCCRTTTARSRTTHSVSAGLDYPAIGPEHAWLARPGRAEYTAVSDDAKRWTRRVTLARIEGIIPALEIAHAVAEVHSRALRR